MSTPLTIRDRAIVNHAKEAARLVGRRDWRNLLEETAETALRGFYGLTADVSPKQAAAMMGVHKNTVTNYLKAGTYFPGAYKTSARRVMIPLGEVLALKERTRGMPE